MDSDNFVVKNCGRCGRRFKSVLQNNFCNDCVTDDQEENQNTEPDYYACYSCGYTTSRKQRSGMCPRCDSYLSEENY